MISQHTGILIVLVFISTSSEAATPPPADASNNAPQQQADQQKSQQAPTTNDGAQKQTQVVQQPAADQEAGLGLSLSLAWYSAYNFRGINVFSADDPHKINSMLAPALTWNIGDTGLSLGYWGAYQLNGENFAQNIEAGLGAEQDLTLGYAQDLLNGDVSLTGYFTAFVYPLARQDVAGERVPVYVEPGVSAVYHGPVDLGLTVASFFATQQSLADYRYLYLNPHIGRTLRLNDAVQLQTSLGYGYKLFVNRDKMTDNVHDFHLDVDVPVAISQALSLSLNGHLAWTNLAQHSLAQETFAYVGVALGYTL